jgi:ABC-2 type transport system ATP-binding protein
MSSHEIEAGTPCLSLQDVHVSFGAQRVLDGLDWALPAGQVVGLLGRNGAGKTTLIETLLGLREADAGEARLFGQPSAALDDAVRARIGYVPQRSDLFGWMTADQVLAYFRSFYPRWNTAKVDGLMSRWDIARDKPISKLSGGQQQRLSIIRALAHEPDLLVLDEPVASLDPAGRRDFLGELVEQVVDRRTTIVFSTHILSDLERVAVDVAFLTGGKIALHAPLDELLESSVRLGGVPADIQRFIADHRLDAVSRSAGVPVIARGRGTGAMPLATPTVSVDRVTLEDLFLALTA